MANTIATYTDHANNVETRVALRRDGQYAVTLRDLDADEVLPVAKIYADVEAAHAYARQILGGAA